MKRTLIACAALSLSACSWVTEYLSGEENLTPPTPLTDITPRVTVNKLWETDIGAGAGKESVRIAPALCNGRLYVAALDGEVSAYDAANGARLWQYDSKAPVASPTACAGDLVLFGTSDARLIALTASDGAARWEAGLSSEVLSMPRMADDTVVVRSVDGRVQGLDAASGERRWVYERATPTLTLRGASSPLIVDGRVIAGFDNGKLAALALADGKLAWEATIAVPHGRTEIERLVDIDADPVEASGVVYVSSFQGQAAAVDAASGRLLWVREQSAHAGLALDSGNVYISDDESRVWALAQDGGSALWKQENLVGRRLTAPAVQGDHVVVGDFEGYLHWLSREDGQFVARTRADSDGFSEAPLSQDGTLYTLGRSGELAAWRIGTE
jgi:outer membrane protein assembly factor BamB